MNPTGIVFPHQLYQKNPLTKNCSTIYLVEEYLYFRQYNFHKQKITFHRASMKGYESYLLQKGIEVVYVDAQNEISDIRKLIPFLGKSGVTTIEYVDTTDNWLEKRVQQACKENKITVRQYGTPLFLNTSEQNESYFDGKQKMYQTDFYKHQRITGKILLENGKKPLGGKWSYDADNRLKYPKGKIPPMVEFPVVNDYYSEAFEYTQQHFSENYGQVNFSFQFPCTYEESKNWLKSFLTTRLHDFGVYEDAIVSGEHILHHGMLTPMLNVGLLTPDEIIEETLSYASQVDIPLNSTEGFIRQIIGWREFMRAVYELKGTEERTKNYWGFNRKIPESFWTGTTGIEPIDITIQKVLKTGYCHHIERLMVLGNFMLLCEFDPDEVYKWYMELFIDAYDWVMVPNVYGMSQFADGGLMSTKPYISGSNYLMKMSDYKKGAWQEVWDGLFWRFMHVHRDFFLQNPRLGMLVNSFDKMPEPKKTMHLKNANAFLEKIT